MRKGIYSFWIYFLSWSLQKSQVIPKEFCPALVKMPSKECLNILTWPSLPYSFSVLTIRLHFNFSWTWNEWHKLKHSVTVHKRLSFTCNACCCSPAHITKILPQKSIPRQRTATIWKKKYTPEKPIKIKLTGLQHLVEKLLVLRNKLFPNVLLYFSQVTRLYN